jgi:hypothetical protein
MRVLKNTIINKILGRITAGKRLALDFLRMTCVMLPVLCLPLYGSGETVETAKQPVGNREAQPPSDAQKGTSSFSEGESVKPPSEKDVKSRGLFSKKKKKKKTGGGSAYSDSPEHRNVQPDDAHVPSR